MQAHHAEAKLEGKQHRFCGDTQVWVFPDANQDFGASVRQGDVSKANDAYLVVILCFDRPMYAPCFGDDGRVLPCEKDSQVTIRSGKRARKPVERPHEFLVNPHGPNEFQILGRAPAEAAPASLYAPPPERLVRPRDDARGSGFVLVCWPERQDGFVSLVEFPKLASACRFLECIAPGGHGAWPILSELTDRRVV